MSRRPLKHRIVDHSVREDVRREFEFHLEQRCKELIADGWSEADAREEAERRFGNRSALEHESRQEEIRRRTTQRRSDMFDVLLQDLKFTFRQLIQRPAFTVASLITLTLGIGAVSTMYTLIQGVLLYELPYDEPTSIVNLWEKTERGSNIRVSGPNFEDWRDQSKSFDALATYSGPGSGVPIVTVNGALNGRRTTVSEDFFEVLAVEPILGRFFTDEETSVGGPPAAIVDEAFWRDRLGAPERLDQVDIRLDGATHAVVGVVPNEMDFPIGTQVWTASGRSEDTSSRTAHNYSVVGRLSSGVSIGDASSELNTIAQRIKLEHGDETDSSEVTISTIKDAIVGSSKRPLLFLFGASALVLILAATNLASGLLARAIERRDEMALRSALGAGGMRLVRQLLTESVVLTTLGGFLGTAFAFAALQLLKRIDSQIPRLTDVRVDVPVLVTTLVVSGLTGLLFGLIPAFKAARVDLRSGLNSARGGDGSKQRLWTTMVASEVALALVLLIGSLMLVSELWQLLSRDTGFDVTEVATLDLAVPNVSPPDTFDLELFQEFERQIALFHDSFSQELASLPGVAGVALAKDLPLGGGGANGLLCLTATDCREDKERQGSAGYRLVSPDYFSLLRVPLIDGRYFEETDTAEREFVAIVNRAFADKYFPEGAVGQQLLSGGMDLHGEVPTRIVGVVANVLHFGPDAEVTTEVYYPAAQRPARTAYASYLVRSVEGSMDALIPTMRSFVTSEYPTLPPEVVSLDEVRVESLSNRRFTLIVLTSLALVALGLALTGIWAVVTYRVAQRREEIGVRMALGLTKSGVLKLVLSDTAKLLTVGVIAGSVLGFTAVRLLRNQIGGLDGGSMIFVLAALVLVTAGFLASWLPARRASTIEPTIAMRRS